MQPVLADTLAAVTEERPKFRRSFELVEQLLQAYGEDQLAERLYGEIPYEIPWEVVADLFGILTWSTSDNGTALGRKTEEWLRSGEDLRRVQVALHLDAYPFLDRSEMERVLNQIAVRHPEVAEVCKNLVDSRRQLKEDETKRA